MNEVFKIRPVNEESNEYVITIGNHLATEERFSSVKKAENAIKKTDWNLVAALISAMKEADEWEKEQLNTEKNG